MTKTIEAQTLSPFVFSPGTKIIAEDVAAVIKQVNYAVANTAEVLLSIHGGDWGGGTFYPHFDSDATGSFASVYRGWVYLPEHWADITIRVISALGASTQSEVRVTIAGHAETLTNTTSASATTTSIDTTDVPYTGYAWVTIEFRRSSGTNSARLAYVSAQINVAVAADLSDPDSGSFNGGGQFPPYDPL